MNLFIFSCLTLNINLLIFNLFGVKHLFFENHTFRKQNRTAVYGRASLVLDFKLNLENYDLLSLIHKHIFEVLHPVQEHTKMWIPNKRYQTNTIRTF